MTQVAMGRSHTCVLTAHGAVFTMGGNLYGQCGRNYNPSIEGHCLVLLRATQQSCCIDVAVVG